MAHGFCATSEQLGREGDPFYETIGLVRFQLLLLS